MLQKRIHSFKYAFRGIGKALKREPNLRIHALATALVTFAGFYFAIAPWQWAIQYLCIGMVWSLELLNTVWEYYLDEKHPEREPWIGMLKDMSAGAVLVAALMAVVVGGIIYIPYLITY